MIAALLFLLLMSMRLGYVKSHLALFASAEITRSYGVPLDVEEVEVRSLNDIRLKGVLLRDTGGDTLLYADEARAYLQTKRLLRGEVRVNTLLLAAPDIRLNRAAPGEDLNAGFLIELFSRDNKEEKSKIDLRINQLLVYDGSLSYDVLSEVPDSAGFDPEHVSVTDFSCNLSLRELHNDTLDLYVRSIAGKEHCGFTLERLRASIHREGDSIHLSNLELRTPLSSIVSDRLEVRTDSMLSNFAISGTLGSDCLDLDDVAPFMKLPLEGVSPLAFSLDGFYNKDSAEVSLSLMATDKSIGVDADAVVLSPFAEQMNGRVVINDLFSNEAMLANLLSLFKAVPADVDVADKLGHLCLSGDVLFDKERIDGKLALGCKGGTLIADASLDSVWNYELSLHGKGLNLERLAGVKSLEACDVSVDMSGNVKDSGNYAIVDGSVTNLVYNDYSYAPISFSARCANDAVTANVKSDDPNAKMQIAAKYDVSEEKILRLSMKSECLSPVALNLYESDKEQDFSFELNGEYIDYGAGKTIVNVKIDNLSLNSEGDTTLVRNFYVSDNKAGDDRFIVVTSDFVKASIYGDFDFKSIRNSLAGILETHLPVLDIGSDEDVASSFANNFYYDVSIKNTIPLTKMFNLPVTVLEPSVINGIFNERENIFNVDAKIFKLDLNGGLIRSFNVNGKTGTAGLALNVQMVKPLSRKIKNFDYNNRTEDIVVRVNANAVSDKAHFYVNWNNFKPDNVMMGTVRMDAELGRDDKHELELVAKIYNDSITHNNKVWHINEGTVMGKMDRLLVENVGLYSGEQSVKVEGVVGKEESDTLKAYLDDFEVATVFDLIKFRILDFSGRATGTALGTGLLSAPNAGGRIAVEDFSIDGAEIGKGDVYVGWENESKSIVLDADIYNKENELSTVKGFLSQPNDTITLKIDANNLNVAFLNRKLGTFLSDIEGAGSGMVHIHGGWRAVDFEGAVALFCSAKLNANNVRYYFSGDSIRFADGVMAFDNARIYDRYGNRGSLSGPLKHTNLSDWTCGFKVTADNMLVYDTDDFGSLPFYATVFATGDASISSDGTGLLLKANAKSMPGSRFVFNSNTTSGASDNSFVTFTDNSKRKKKESLPVPGVEKKDAYNKTASKMTLDFMLDVNESLEVKVYTDLQTDDYISLYGNGTINAIYDDKTGFSMKGHMNLDRGVCKFTVQDIFTKVFDITKGSTLTFNGDPYKTDLNLNAKYLVPSASLGDLTTEVARRKTVKVNCIIDITGSLASPNLAFDLELPEGSEEERELLASVASTPDQKDMQFIYLLGVGKFYTFDANSAQAGMTNSTSAVESFISNTISGQINNMLGKIINSGNWDISGNISTSERGWNSMEVEGMLRGRLLNNRLQINGNLGYRENPIANRNFIGDFELLWLLSPKYNWNIKAYSKTNDRYFSKTDLTTQGVGTSILLEFDRWKWWGRKKNRKEKRTETLKTVETGSEIRENDNEE